MRSLIALIVIALLSGCAVQRSINRTAAHNKLMQMCEEGDTNACHALATTPAQEDKGVGVIIQQ